MKGRLSAAATLFGVIGIAGNANAGLSNVVFEYTYSPYQLGSEQLILNGGSTVLNATSTGWYDSSGNHDATNPDYIAGTCGSSDACNGENTATNDYFAFDLSNVSGAITSAVLSLYNPSSPPAPGPGFLSILPLTYTNFDVTTPVADLVASNSGAVDIYNDLGSGTVYASTIVTDADNGTQINIDLDTDALNAIFAAEGGLFAIGGSVTSAVPTSSVPEPITISLFGTGLAGAVIVRRRKKLNA